MRALVGALVLLAMVGLSNPARADAFDAFFMAIKMDDAQRLRNWLLRGMDPNTISNEGLPALAYAVVHESPQALAVLLQHQQTDLEQSDTKGDTALMIAASRSQADAIKVLLEAGAKADREGQWSALHYAAAAGCVPCVQLLANFKANLDAMSENGTTPLMMAARSGREDTARLLLKLGANPSPVNEAGFNAAGYAMRSKRSELAFEIMRKEKALRKAP